MALMPKRVKRRKQHRGILKGRARSGNYVVFGDFGLQATERGWLSSRQIEAGRVACSHFLAGEGRIWIRAFPHKPVTAKPAEVRMGTGKGDVDHWVAVVKPGRVLFELEGVSVELARRAMQLASAKLPLKTKFVQHGLEDQ